MQINSCTGRIGAVFGYKVIESVHCIQAGYLHVPLMSRTGKYRGVVRKKRVQVPGMIVDETAKVIIIHPARMNQLRIEIAKDMQDKIDVLARESLG